MNKKIKQILGIVALIISAFFAEQYLPNQETNNSTSPRTNNRTESNIDKVVAGRKSGQMVLIEARIIKHLRDDLKGDKHQKMLLKTGKHTLLLAHNIDIAPRVPAKEGETIQVKGEYEWNEKGGVIHWTHRSNNSHPQGWIKYNNKKYD